MFLLWGITLILLYRKKVAIMCQYRLIKRRKEGAQENGRNVLPSGFHALLYHDSTARKRLQLVSWKSTHLLLIIIWAKKRERAKGGAKWCTKQASMDAWTLPFFFLERTERFRGVGHANNSGRWKCSTCFLQQKKSCSTCIICSLAAVYWNGFELKSFCFDQSELEKFVS